MNDPLVQTLRCARCKTCLISDGPGECPSCRLPYDGTPGLVEALVERARTNLRDYDAFSSGFRREGIFGEHIADLLLRLLDRHFLPAVTRFDWLSNCRRTLDDSMRSPLRRRPGEEVFPVEAQLLPLLDRLYVALPAAGIVGRHPVSSRRLPPVRRADLLRLTEIITRTPPPVPPYGIDAEATLSTLKNRRLQARHPPSLMGLMTLPPFLPASHRTTLAFYFENSRECWNDLCGLGGYLICDAATGEQIDFDVREVS